MCQKVASIDLMISLADNNAKSVVNLLFSVRLWDFFIYICTLKRISLFCQDKLHTCIDFFFNLQFNNEIKSNSFIMCQRNFDICSFRHIHKINFVVKNNSIKIQKLYLQLTNFCLFFHFVSYLITDSVKTTWRSALKFLVLEYVC